MEFGRGWDAFSLRRPRFLRVRDELISPIPSCTPWCVLKKTQRSNLASLKVTRVCGLQGVFSLEPSFLFVHLKRSLTTGLLPGFPLHVIGLGLRMAEGSQKQENSGKGCTKAGAGVVREGRKVEVVGARPVVKGERLHALAGSLTAERPRIGIYAGCGRAQARCGSR